MENSELVISATSSKLKNYSNYTANTSHSTINPNITSKGHETANQIPEKGIITHTPRQLNLLGASAISNANNTFVFQSDCFLSHYQQYLVSQIKLSLKLMVLLQSSLPKDYLSYETEESMSLRQNAELIELQKAHLMQKRSLLDRRQANLNNLISIPGISDDFAIKDYDDMHKVRSPNGVDPMLLSPISSGYLPFKTPSLNIIGCLGYISPDDALAIDENNYFCQNNSTEIMSMIGKFNPQNNSVCEEWNKSSSLLAAGELALHGGNTNHTNTGSNSSNINAVNSLMQGQAFPAFNPTQLNARLTPLISPKGSTDINFQPFSSQPKRTHRPRRSQKNEFSPVIVDHNPRRAHEAAQNNVANQNGSQAHPSEGNNKQATPNALVAAVQEYKRN